MIILSLILAFVVLLLALLRFTMLDPSRIPLSGFGSRGGLDVTRCVLLVRLSRLRLSYLKGCLPETADDGWDEIVNVCSPETFGRGMLNQSFSTWMGKVENQLADIAGLTGKQRDAFCSRATGPRFVVRSALGVPGSNTSRYSPIAVAWGKIAVWLTDWARAFDPCASLHVLARARRVQ